MSEARLRVVLLRHTPNPEEIVAQAAKLCYSPASIEDLQKQIEENDQTGFVSKLVDMHHLSPFEHISFTFGVEGISRACSHQLVRHRLASYSQQSQRYVKEVDFGYIIPESIKNVRGLCLESIATADVGELKDVNGCEWLADKMTKIQEWYNELIGRNVPAEDARFVLPNACETKIVVTMNARELQHFFKHRCCHKSQWEIRAMANKMLVLCKEKAPTIFASSGPSCVTGACHEQKPCLNITEIRSSYLGRAK